jgi:hypothetical protein
VAHAVDEGLRIADQCRNIGGVSRLSVYTLRMVVTGAIILGLLLGAGSADGDEPGDIVRQLMPVGDHFEVDLKGMSRTTAIKELLAAQKNATAQRSQDIAFLLAAVGSEYEKNRNFLLGILRQCVSTETLQ